jgi:hypothetical protein
MQVQYLILPALTGRPRVPYWPPIQRTLASFRLLVWQRLLRNLDPDLRDLELPDEHGHVEKLGTQRTSQTWWLLQSLHPPIFWLPGIPDPPITIGRVAHMSCSGDFTSLRSRKRRRPHADTILYRTRGAHVPSNS